MKIITYLDAASLQEDLCYWSNALGELHHHGQYDIEREELPDPLLCVYNNLFGSTKHLLSYLADYDGQYGLLLTFEAGGEHVTEPDMEKLWMNLKAKAEEYGKSDLLKASNIIILLGHCTGANECHELHFFIPWHIQREKLNEVEKYLDDTICEEKRAENIFDERWKELNRKYNDRCDLTEEQDREYAENAFQLYEEEGFVPFFEPSDNNISKHAWDPFEVVSRATEDDADLECLPLWWIKFSDEEKVLALPNEICIRECNGVKYDRDHYPHRESRMQDCIYSAKHEDANFTVKTFDQKWNEFYEKYGDYDKLSEKEQEAFVEEAFTLCGLHRRQREKHRSADAGNGQKKPRNRSW